jgi:hypothetical protein
MDGFSIFMLVVGVVMVGGGLLFVLTLGRSTKE